MILNYIFIGGETIRSDSMAGCSNSGFLFIWSRVWIFDRLRLVQHSEEQLCKRRATGLSLQRPHRHLCQRRYFRNSWIQSYDQRGQMYRNVSF